MAWRSATSRAASSSAAAAVPSPSNMAESSYQTNVRYVKDLVLQDYWQGFRIPNTHSREADAMRKLTFGMNLSLDGYIAASGDDLGWSAPGDGLFQWGSDRGAATGLRPDGREPWGTLS